ncbi:hypothetical protein AOLI_G00276670 [Acnodon oligacanthus]
MYEEQQSEKRKKGKKKRSRSKWRIYWKKDRKRKINKEEKAEKEKGLINQQPVKVEEGALVLGLPVGLVSSLESVLAETLEDTAPPPQENLTEEEDATIQHLMKMLLDEVRTCMEQLLKAETVQITVADEAAAEATNNTIQTLDNQLLKMSDGEVNDHQIHSDLEEPEPTDIHPLAGDERLKLKDHAAEPKTAEEHLDLKEASDSDDQPLVDIKKSHPPEEEVTNKRKTRRGTREKGQKIIYNKDKHPNEKLDGQRGSRGSSGQTNNIKNCDHERREVIYPRRVHLEWDGKSNDVPHTFTVWKTGWTEETATEGLHWWQDYIKNCGVGQQLGAGRDG